MASNPSSSVSDAPQYNFVVIPVDSDGQAFPDLCALCNTPDESKKAAEAFGADGLRSVEYQATRVYGQVTETRVLWQPKVSM